MMPLPYMFMYDNKGFYRFVISEAKTFKNKKTCLTFCIEKLTLDHPLLFFRLNKGQSWGKGRRDSTYNLEGRALPGMNIYEWSCLKSDSCLMSIVPDLITDIIGNATHLLRKVRHSFLFSLWAWALVSLLLLFNHCNQTFRYCALSIYTYIYISIYLSIYPFIYLPISVSFF